MTALHPMLRLHLRLTGGWRNNLLIVGGMVALILIAVSLSKQLIPDADRGAISGFWLALMTFGQSAFVFLISQGAIRRAVQRDYASGMIESHRLTPMSSLWLTVGYLLGAPLQAILLWSAGLLLGLYFAIDYAVTLQLPARVVGSIAFGWLLTNLGIVLMGFMLAALTLLTSIASAGKTGAFGAIFVLGIFGYWAIIPLVPGVALLLGVLSGATFYNLMTNQTLGGSPRVVVITAALHATFGALLAWAACRKIRRPHEPAFSMPLGLLLLGLTGFTLVLGLRLVADFTWVLRVMELQQMEGIGAGQVLASTIAFAVVAQLPLFAAAHARWQFDRLPPAAAVRRPAAPLGVVLMPLIIALLTAAAGMLLMRFLDATHWTPGLHAIGGSTPLRATIVAALLLSFWTDSSIGYLCLSRERRPAFALLFFCALLKVVPILAQLAINGARTELDAIPRDLADGVLTGLSPIGTMVLAALNRGNLWPGLLGQLGIALLWWHLVRRARAKAPLVRPG